MKKSTVRTRSFIDRKTIESLVRREIIGKDGDKYIQYTIVPENRINQKGLRNPRPHPTLPGCYIVEEDFNPNDWPPFVINRIA
jgi:hypothetical protein